ncbi:hypothetical protein CIG19_14775 [Enterobacterales bacterium CwR94]|nr:hypothetical protein CIG19_14775 [Enterobacterales bacterium CwR94]
MKKIRLPLIHLPGIAPTGDIYSREQLAQYVQANDILEQAAQEAARLLKAAENERQETHARCAALIEQAKREGIQQGQAAVETTRQQVITETVQWLVDEKRLEEQIANLMQERLQEMVQRIVEPYLMTCDPVPLLIQRVDALMHQYLHENNLELYVSHEHIPQLSHAFSGNVPLTLIADDTLSLHQARLVSPCAIVWLDLKQHLRLLMEQFAPQVKQST